MINPNGDEFTEDDPLAASQQSSTGEISIPLRPQSAPALVSGDNWKQAKDRLETARDRTELFVRENPVPIIVGALALGLAAGWALRHATREEKEVEIKTPLGDFNWSFLSLPFLWPFIKSVKAKYEDSTETIKDVARDGVDRVRKIDIDRYAKPLRKRWKNWTH
jgi:hypothetical protein